MALDYSIQKAASRNDRVLSRFWTFAAWVLWKASAEDEQRLAELVEKEIVGRNLLGAFGPLLVRGPRVFLHCTMLLMAFGPLARECGKLC